MEIQVFKSPQFGEIRTAGTPDSPLFCLADVCKVLELRADGVMTRLNNPSPIRIGVGVQTGIKKDGTPAIQQVDMVFINEQNLYKVIMRSDKPQAEPFQDWVCGEVLPSIRRAGAYMTGDTLERALTSPDFLIRLAGQLKGEQHRRIEAERIARERQITIDTQQATITEQAPKVLFADTVASSSKSILVAELAKLIRQNGYETGQNRMFKWLRRHGYLCSKGEMFNTPTQRAMESGYFEIKKTSITRPDGTVLVTTTPKITPKGQIHLIDKFIGEYDKEKGIAV